MSRCQICGKEKVKTAEIYAPEYSVRENRRVEVCSSCFDLVASDNHAEIRVLIEKKLIGEGYNVASDS